MNEFYAESFMLACEKGNLDEARRMVGQGVDINHIDKNGNNGFFQAAKSGQLHILHYLLQNEAILSEVYNKENCTPLHYACDQVSKEMMLFFIFNGIDVNQKNAEGKKAGEGNADSKMFMNKILEEQACFAALNLTQKKKLIQIFQEIDYDEKNMVDFEKAFKFNKYMEDTVNDNMASKDAHDFISSLAICNKTTVNLDEWLYAFAKLAAVDQETYDKFITEYDTVCESRGKFADFVK